MSFFHFPFFFSFCFLSILLPGSLLKNNWSTSSGRVLQLKSLFSGEDLVRTFRGRIWSGSGKASGGSGATAGWTFFLLVEPPIGLTGSWRHRLVKKNARCENTSGIADRIYPGRDHRSRCWWTSFCSWIEFWFYAADLPSPERIPSLFQAMTSTQFELFLMQRM